MCPFCSHPRSRVVATENFGTFIRRRRRCDECNGEFYGVEEFGGIIKPPPNFDPAALKIPEKRPA